MGKSLDNIDGMVKANLVDTTLSPDVRVPFYGKFRSTKFKKKKQDFLCNRCGALFFKPVMVNKVPRCPECLSRRISGKRHRFPDERL